MGAPTKGGQFAGYTPSRITASGQVGGSGPRVLRGITLNGTTVAGTLTIYDNTAASGTAPFILPIATSTTPSTIFLDAAFTNGIYAAYDGTLAGAITFLWA